MPSYVSGPCGIRVRLDVIACTDRRVVLVLAGTNASPPVAVHTFAYGELDARTKLIKATPELESDNGRPVLVLPRLQGREAKYDELLAAPPATRDPELDVRPPDTPAGWHPDPSRRHQLRYWDGTAWTAHAADNGVTVHDPLS